MQPPQCRYFRGKPGLQLLRGFSARSGHSQLAARMCAEAFQSHRGYNDDDVEEDVSQEQPRAIRGQGREIQKITPTVDWIKEKVL